MGSPIVHFELIGKDAAQLKAFYTQLFGWEIGDLMPDMGNYGLIDGAVECACRWRSDSPTTANRGSPSTLRWPTCRPRSTRRLRSAAPS